MPIARYLSIRFRAIEVGYTYYVLAHPRECCNVFVIPTYRAVSMGCDKSWSDMRWLTHR